MIRAAFIAVIMFASGSAFAQTPEAGCRPPINPQLVGQASDFDYVITDTGDLNVVLTHLVGQTTLSDRSCLPDPEQGALQVVVNYGVTSDTPPAEHAHEIVFGVHARTQPERRPIDFPPITAEPIQVNGMPGAEAISRDESTAGVPVFRYALVFVFPDGAKGLISASGPADRFDALRPTFQRIAAGLRPRRNVEEMQQEMTQSMDAMLERLRGPLIDQSLDACLNGESTQQAAIARAAASGFPAFTPQTRIGRQWQVTQVPSNDAAQLSFGLMEGASTVLSGQRSLTCAIVASRGLGPLFRQKFEARFPGLGTTRLFTLTDGSVAPASGAIRLDPGDRLGRVTLETTDTIASITIEITSRR